MSLIELKKVFEKRRYNLIQTLENNKDELDLAKQHQIYGAIKEIENFLKTIDYHREIEINSDTTFQLRSDREQPFLRKITLKLKNKAIIE
jgi:hypothetical protein